MVELGFPRLLRSTRRVPGRMAGARRPGASPAGCGAAPRLRRLRQAGAALGAFLGRRGLALLLPLFFVGAAQAQVVAARIWPAPEYTRLTIESKEEIKYTVFSIRDPSRLVLDLETNDLSPVLTELKMKADDPHVGGLRAARNRPGVVRLVLDLKGEVNAQ